MLTKTTIKTPCGRILDGSPSIVLGGESESLKGNFRQLLDRRLGAMLRSSDPRLASEIYAISPEAKARIEMDRVAQGMFGVGALFNWADAEVIWEIEKSKDFLSEEMNRFMSDFPDLAERRTRVDELYKEGKITEALERYHLLEGAYQARDFSFAIDIGNLLLFGSKDLTVADRYFARAVKFAERNYPSFASFALLHRALIRFNLNSLDDAALLSARACELCPDIPEGFYQHAQYQILMGNRREALTALREAIKADRLYLLKSLQDDIFEEFEGELISLSMEIAEPARADIAIYVDTFRNVHNELEESEQGVSEPLAQLRALAQKTFTTSSKFEHLDGALDTMVSVRRLGELAKELLVNIQQTVIYQNRQLVECKSALKGMRAQQSTLASWIQKVSLMIAPTVALSSCVILVNDTNPDHMLLGLGIALAIGLGGTLLGKLVNRLMRNNSEIDQATSKLKLEKKLANYLENSLKLVENLPIMKDKNNDVCGTNL